jgi:ankyrin repeat protein
LKWGAQKQRGMPDWARSVIPDRGCDRHNWAFVRDGYSNIGKAAEATWRCCDAWVVPLYCAIIAGHLEVVTTLLELKADVQAVDDWGRTALHIAAGRDHNSPHEITAALLKHRADVEAADSTGRTALHFAAWTADDTGHLDVAEAQSRRGGKGQ